MGSVFGFFSRSALASTRLCSHPNHNSPSTIRPVKPQSHKPMQRTFDTPCRANQRSDEMSSAGRLVSKEIPRVTNKCRARQNEKAMATDNFPFLLSVIP
jgi:hypothetical protein